MHMYRLATIYRELHAATRRGDQAAAIAAIGEAIGTTLPMPAPGASATLEPGLTYRGFKPAELAMLAADVKPIVKFEDIPIAAAERFAAEHGATYKLTRSAPYTKDYFLLRSSPTKASNPTALVTIYASRSAAGQQLHDLERSHPADVYRSGELLSIPACCVEAFAADAKRSRADQDTVNDDACKRLLRSVPNGTGHPALDPLSDLELLGFYPCSLTCEAAVSRAREVYRALLQVSPQSAAGVRLRLGRPTLFFRLPFFAHIVEQTNDDRALCVVNCLPGKTVRSAQRLFGTALATFTAGTEQLTVDRQTDAITLTAIGRDKPKKWLFRREAAPVVTHYKPWPAQFFDPS
jgi:hypothetical protein